jgi:hypothetical protein
MVTAAERSALAEPKKALAGAAAGAAVRATGAHTETVRARVCIGGKWDGGVMELKEEAG